MRFLPNGVLDPSFADHGVLETTFGLPVPLDPSQQADRHSDLGGRDRRRRRLPGPRGPDRRGERRGRVRLRSRLVLEHRHLRGVRRQADAGRRARPRASAAATGVRRPQHCRKPTPRRTQRRAARRPGGRRDLRSWPLEVPAGGRVGGARPPDRHRRTAGGFRRRRPALGLDQVRGAGTGRLDPGARAPHREG